MTKISINLITLISVCSMTSSFANTERVKIIYGEDNRIESYEASKRDQVLASATAGMIETKKIIDLGTRILLPPKSIQSSMGLCEDERFKDQPTSMICSGFLIAPNIMVTAGHCIGNQARCENVKFVFDYKINPKTKRANMIVSKDNVYSCKKLIDAKLTHDKKTGNQRDYALIELDRNVEGVTPLKYRTQGMIKNNQSIMVIGHPSGLPQKVTGDARIFENNSKMSFFKTNLDTYGGNSGSATFDEATGLVEGILVRGAKDYIKNPSMKCISSNREVENISRRMDLGESVTRITDIPALRLKGKLNAAVKAGDLNLVVRLLAAGANTKLLDSDMAKKLLSMYTIPAR